MVAMTNQMSCITGNAGMPELLQEVAGRLVSVEEGLAALDNHKTALNSNAEMVKGEICSAVERQMNVLRSREKQLIRQVEVASTHQHCEVTLTQAQLLQHKGALAVTRTILDSCPTQAEVQGLPHSTPSKCNDSVSVGTAAPGVAGGCSDVATSVRNTIATTVNCLPHQDVAGLLDHTEKLLRVPLVSVSADEAPLQGSIQRWGRVTLPPSLSHSDLLPHCLEEYGDADHHVLHKSVRPAGQPTQPIDVRKPYLLAAKAGVSNVCFPNTAPSGNSMELNPLSGVKPPAKKVESSSAKEDLLKWLHRMQLDTEEETPRRKENCGDCMCLEDACQANEPCASFSECLMSGLCKKNALEKLDQTARWQQQHQNLTCEDPDTIPLQFAMDMSFTARKRPLSDNCSPSLAAQAVISHMTNIRTSNNGTWLLPLTLTKKQVQTVDCKLQPYKYTQNMNVGSPIKLENYNKKQKLCHSAPSIGGARYSILYKAPIESSWVLPSKTSAPCSPSKPLNNLKASDKMSLDCTSQTVSKVSELTDTAKVYKFKYSADYIDKNWLLRSSETAGKKAYCDKENNLCRASMMKSHLGCSGSIENLVEKIERISVAAKKVSAPQTDIERKESWLLQQCSSYKTDNKVLDEAIKKNSEWLSNSSLASFSIITDSDILNNSWLLNNQL